MPALSRLPLMFVEWVWVTPKRFAESGKRESSKIFHLRKENFWSLRGRGGGF